MKIDSIRLKDALQMPLSYGLNESATEDNHKWPRYIRITDFDDNNNLREDTFRSINPEKANMYSLQKGDILLARSGTVGKAFCFNENIRACYAGYLIRARLNHAKVLPKYFLYVTKSIHYSEWKKRTNIQSTIQNISAKKYNQYEFPCPTINKQEKIIKYLDAKLSEISHQVSLLTSKRDAYLRLKKSIINNAVTRGLNPNVEMKDSGIEWIGEVPENWEVKRFKDIFTKWTTGITPDSKNTSYFEYDSNKGFTWVTISDLSEKYISQSDINLSNKSIKQFVPPITHKGSLMFSFKLSVGKLAFADKDLYTNEAIASILPNSKQCLDYHYYILPMVLYNNATENIYGAKMLNQKRIANMQMLVPPLTEQRAIAAYLDDKCSKIGTIVSNLDKQISRYGDLKRSLINEVITGKRAV